MHLQTGRETERKENRKKKNILICLNARKRITNILTQHIVCMEVG